MSDVTNVLVLATGQKHAMRTLTSVDSNMPWAGGARFVDLAHGDPVKVWVGPKYPEFELWAAAFNHLDRSALLAALEECPWTNPAGVQVLMQGQDDEAFGLWMFQGGRLCEVSIPGVTRVGLGPHAPGEKGNHGRLVRSDIYVPVSPRSHEPES
jgi:hypothetical protein